MMVEAGDGSPTWVRALDQGSSALAVFFFFKTSFRWIIFKVFIEFVTILLLCFVLLAMLWFYVLFFWP